MVRILMIAIWASLVTALSSYGAATWIVAHQNAAKAEPEKEAIELKKTRVINVPIIAGGMLQGYVIAQFLYAVNAKQQHPDSLSPDAFILDSAFKILYGDDKLDFRHLEKYDINKMTQDLRAMVNDEMHADVVKEVLIQDFSFMPKNETPR